MTIPSVRTSERKSFKTCRQQWWWGYIERLKPHEESKPLVFGTLMHEALAEYYIPGRKRGIAPAATFERLYKEHVNVKTVVRTEDDDMVDMLELGIHVLRHYVEHYGDDDDIDILMPEMPIQVVLRKGGVPRVRYLGQLDAVFRKPSNGTIWLLEHKSAKTIKTGHLPLDEQAGSYWAMAPMYLRNIGVLEKGQDLDGIMYNFVRKAVKDTRPTNAEGHALNKPSKEALLSKAVEVGLQVKKSLTVPVLTEMLQDAGVDPTQLGEVSARQPAPYFLRKPVYRGRVDRLNLLNRIFAEVHDMEQVRQGKSGVYKNPGDHCAWCPFRDMCELHETGSNWEEYRDLTMYQWDPYEAHNDERPNEDED